MCDINTSGTVNIKESSSNASDLQNLDIIRNADNCTKHFVIFTKQTNRWNWSVCQSALKKSLSTWRSWLKFYIDVWNLQNFAMLCTFRWTAINSLHYQSVGYFLEISCNDKKCSLRIKYLKCSYVLIKAYTLRHKRRLYLYSFL